MKVKSFKKLFVSITLSAALTFSTAATTFAATAQAFSPIEQPAELTQEATSDVPDIDFSDTQNAGASLTAQSRNQSGSSYCKLCNCSVELCFKC